MNWQCPYVSRGVPLLARGAQPAHVEQTAAPPRDQKTERSKTMHKDKKTGAPILSSTEARQAERVGLIWVLVASLAFVAIISFAVGGYVQ